ncbi:MAG: DUF4388 domain-containing protein, partial [Planctomycetota bacterium]
VTELMSGDSLSSDFVTKGPARVGRLPRAAFEGMLLKYPEIGISLSRILASKARELEGPSASLAGGLEVLDLPALIQAVSLRQKTCVIELPDLPAEIGFIKGQIVSVTCGDQTGREAFFDVMRQEPTNFRLAVQSVRCQRNVNESTMNLLLECARHMDEKVV